jgi:hypothetical protein
LRFSAPIALAVTLLAAAPAASAAPLDATASLAPGSAQAGAPAASSLAPALASPLAGAAQATPVVVDPGTYGGGAFGRYVSFATVRVDRARRRASALGLLVYDCGFRTPLTDTIRLNATEIMGNSVQGASLFTDDIPSGLPEIGGLRRRGVLAVTVRLHASGVATGRMRTASVFEDPRTGQPVNDPRTGRQRACDSGSVRFRARIPSRAAARGRPRPARRGSYFGTSRQRQPVLLKVSRTGRRVERAGMTFRVRCESALGLPLDVVALDMPIVRGGRFGNRGTFVRLYRSSTNGAVREDYRWTLRGRFGRRGATGTWRVTGTARLLSNNRRVGSCDTGRRSTWTVVR